MKIGSIVRHPELGLGQITFIREGFPNTKVLFASGEQMVLVEEVDLNLTGEPIDRFQGENRWLSNFEEAEVTFEGIVIRKILALVKEWAKDKRSHAGDRMCKADLRNLVNAIERVEIWY